jgi:prepilin-type N-terminal cleavage/methylation domain-containing protein
MKPKAAAHGFTIVELLVVVSIITVLASLLFPVYSSAKLRAKVARVHSDLRQVGIAIQMYYMDWEGLPPVRSSCMNNAQIDYYQLPLELYKGGYLAIDRMIDPFNDTPDQDGSLGRTYKYVAINWGYSNNTITEFGMWIPRDYPKGEEDCVLYYRRGKSIYVFDKGKTYPKEPPIVWAVWSVGPGGDPGWVESGSRMLPVPKKEWYPYNEKGVITLLSDGNRSP